MATTIEEASTPVDYLVIALKLLFAVSPLLVLAYILLSAWEDPEAEEVKRRKKTDFELDGHAE
eukprot:CAMPEP_0202480406 /NCGR_PEP_ID=MMETSP1361-20130828/412_1 /ASSEMBLY_ACC=CAM_ASM_000849 /TAXON_ID=210615 /ORGANISM="Staurosira complex sp., Strain CCMP2646" /LENGTH=62 /DNA_ID=CAMNT_0049107837 /DNA_START=79 /DNA_END=267 /DNA_ORIENTATION=+